MKVLVVDDEPAIRLLCRVNLQAEGFEVVEEAHAGRRAARVAREWQPDLILLDVMMPGATRTSWRSARDLRADPVRGQAADRASSRRAPTCAARRSRRSPAPVGYLTKPFNPLELAPTLRRIAGVD